MRHQLKKRDLILIAALILAALLWAAYNRYSARPAAIAKVSVDGQTVVTLDLSRDTQLTVPGFGGGSNHLTVANGLIWCDQASCPDKLCVKQGKKHLSTDTIVCLPNRMIVTIENER